MSFLEDRDPPSRRSSGGASRQRARRRAPAGRPTSDRTVNTRRGVALAATVILLLLAIVGVRACRDQRAEQGLTDYARTTSGLLEQSQQQSDSLFELLGKPSEQSAVELESAVNGLRTEAEQLAERARGVDHPSDLTDAQRYLVETLDLRRDGLAGVARELPQALGDDGRDEAVERMVADMRSFLASDVLYAQRFAPAVTSALERRELLGEVSVRMSQFLGDVNWLREGVVSRRIKRIRSGEGEQAASPGVHGTGLGPVAVTPPGDELDEGTPVELAATEGLTFEVPVENQGESKEEVTVKISIKGAGKPIEIEKQLDSPLAAGQSDTVSVPLADKPPTGRRVAVAVEVVPVPGEEETDNNERSFPITFVQ